jgi:hypothetical protein
MSFFARTLFFCVFLCSLLGCSKQESVILEKESSIKVVLTVLDGYSLPGTVETAKSNGFTSCDKTYKCKKNGEIQLLTIPVKSAFIIFNQEDRKGYDSIYFTIPRVNLDSECALKAKNFLENEKCVLPSNLERFKKQLAALNWKKDPDFSKRYTAYYHPDFEIKIAIQSHDDEGNVILQHISSIELSKKLARVC